MDSTPRLGTERYAIRRPIGGGAAGLVYEAWDRHRKQAVAVKTLRTPTPDALYRLKQEFRSLADLSHPNLVRFDELVGTDDAWFIVMELVEGRSFLGWVRDQENPRASLGHTASWPSPSQTEEGETPPAPAPSPPPDTARLRAALVQVARGVAALHAAGRLHRDLKPENVLVDATGRVVLVDFGLVYETDRAASEMSRVDRVVGTAAYMAPEQARGEAPSEASDLYAVGVMLYQALTGRLPFEGALVRILLQKQQEDPPPPRSLVPDLPEDLDRLCVDLLARDPDARPSAVEVLERLGDAPGADDPLRADLRRLEGREVQRQALEEAWARARLGRATLALVRGRPGMGKSGLVAHFLAELKKHEDVTVLRGRCYEREKVPFKAFDHLVDGLRRRLERLPDHVREAVLPPDVEALARVFPVLAPLVPRGAARADADPTDLRARAFTAFGALVRNLTALRPVVAFLDDAQWGDLDSARLLEVLLHDVRDCRFLLVLAYRTEDEESSPFLAEILRDPVIGEVETRRLDVEELPPDTATAVARALLGDALADPSAAAVWLARESGGSPFLMAELARAVRHAAEGGDRQPDLSRFTVDGVFRARVEGLEPAPRRLLEAVSLAGRPMPLRVFVRAAGLDDEGIDVAAPLRARHLVRTTRGPLGDVIEPYHARIAAAVVAQVPEEARPALHAAIAQAMEGSPFDDPEVRMHHVEQSGDRDTAGLLAMQAARHAADALAFGRAADLYEAALSLRDWPPEERLALEVEWADALAYAGRGEPAARVWLSVADRSPTPAALALRRRAAGQLVFAGRVAEGLGWLVGTVEATGVPRAPAHPGWTTAITWWRRLWARRKPIDFAPVPEAQVDPATLRSIDTCWDLSLGLGLVDPITCGWYHALGLQLALDAREPYRAARAIAMELAQGEAWGQSSPDLQARLVRRGRELALQSGKAHATGLVAFGEGMVAFQEGRWDAARRALSRAHRTFVEQCAGVAFEVATSRLYAIKARLWGGEIAEAADEHRRLLREAREMGNLFVEDALRTDICVWLPLARGDIDRVRADLEDVLARWSRPAWDENRFLAFCGTVERLLWEGRPGDAMAEIRAREPDIRRAWLQLLGTNRRRLADLRGRAAVALVAQGDGGARREAVRAAKRLKAGKASAPPLGHLVQAGLCAAQGDAAGAADALRLAVRGFDQARMELHAHVARARLGALIGGAEGDREAAVARQWFERAGVTEPERLVALLAPGFGA